MIDFLKIYIYNKNLISKVWNNELLVFDRTIERLTNIDGDINTTEIRKYKNFEFKKVPSTKRKPERLEITGSLHYYFNNGIHNANDFSMCDCVNTIHELQTTFKLILSDCFVINLEYAANIVMPYDIESFIVNLKYHSKNEFRRLTAYKNAKESTSFNNDGVKNKYKIIKAYDKGIQLFDGKNYAKPNTFRFEIKSNESKYIRALGINTLADLLKVEVYNRFSIELIKEWNRVLLLDRVTNFDNDKRAKKYINVDFWERQILSNNRNDFARHRNNYFCLLSEYPNNIHDTIKKILQKKINELSIKCANSTLLETTIRASLEQPQKTKSVQIPTYILLESAHLNNTQNNHSKLCQITGLNISMQKDNSILLSHTGLKYYQKNNRKIFEQIRLKYLSKIWYNADIEIQIKEIAHNIRNTKSNQKIKQVRLCKPRQINLLQSFAL